MRLLLAALLFIPVPAIAAEDPTVWSVRPAGADGKADARTNFVLQGKPGDTIADQVLVTNLSKTPVTFNVYGTDAFNTPQGQFDLLSADKKPTALGSWITMSNTTVTIKPGLSVPVPFKVVVPQAATPGDYGAGVVVSLLTLGTGEQGRVNVDSRVAVRVYLRIPGNLRPRLAVGPVDLAYAKTSNPFGKGTLAIAYTVTNTGNIRLRGKVHVKVTSVFGMVAELNPEDMPELLPNQNATFPIVVPQVFPAGPLTATVTVSPYPDPQQPVGQDVPAVSGSGDLWAIPWLLLAIVAAVLLLVGGLWWWTRRRINKLVKGKTA